MVSVVLSPGMVLIDSSVAPGTGVAWTPLASAGSTTSTVLTIVSEPLGTRPLITTGPDPRGVSLSRFETVLPSPKMPNRSWLRSTKTTSSWSRALGTSAPAESKTCWPSVQSKPARMVSPATLGSGAAEYRMAKA